jgi:hypothetical protein
LGHGALVALDRDVSHFQRVRELSALPDQRAEGRGVGLDDRIRVVRRAAIDLDRPVGDPDGECVLAQAQLVAGGQVAGGIGVEERPEGEDDGEADRGRLVAPLSA